MTRILGWLSTPAFTLWGADTTWAELLGFLSGALCVVLVARQHIANWPLGIVNNLMWLLLFAQFGLYADSGLQGVFIVLGLWGWWSWVSGGRDNAQRPVSRTPRSEWFGLVLVGAAGTAGLTWVLTTQTPSTVPFWDAVTTILSLLAVYGQGMKRLESWLLWMAADVIYVPLYVSKDLHLTAVLYVGFFVLCVLGLRAWHKDWAAEDSTAAPGMVVV